MIFRDLKPVIINTDTFNFLKKFGWSQVPKNRYITLIFDMVLANEVNPDMDGSEAVPSHVVLVAIQVINFGGFQPIGTVFLHKNAPAWKLSKCIKAYIYDLWQCDLKVLSTICPPWDFLRAVVEDLVEVNKLPSPTAAHTYSTGFLNNIVHVYDASCMLKEVRNLFIEGSVKFKQCGHRYTANYKDIEEVLGICKDESLKNIPEMLKRLDDNYYAVRLFSMSMYHELREAVSKGKIEDQGTAEFCAFFDALFDTFNSEPHSTKCNRLPLTSSSSHHKIWKQFIPVLKSMTCTGPYDSAGIFKVKRTSTKNYDTGANNSSDSKTCEGKCSGKVRTRKETESNRSTALKDAEMDDVAFNPGSRKAECRRPENEGTLLHDDLHDPESNQQTSRAVNCVPENEDAIIQNETICTEKVDIDHVNNILNKNHSAHTSKKSASNMLDMLNDTLYLERMTKDLDEHINNDITQNTDDEFNAVHVNDPELIDRYRRCTGIFSQFSNNPEILNLVIEKYNKDIANTSLNINEVELCNSLLKLNLDSSSTAAFLKEANNSISEKASVIEYLSENGSWLKENLQNEPTSADTVEVASVSNVSHSNVIRPEPSPAETDLKESVNTSKLSDFQVMESVDKRREQRLSTEEVALGGRNGEQRAVFANKLKGNTSKSANNVRTDVALKVENSLEHDKENKENVLKNNKRKRKLKAKAGSVPPKNENRNDENVNLHSRPEAESSANSFNGNMERIRKVKRNLLHNFDSIEADEELLGVVEPVLCEKQLLGRKFSDINLSKTEGAVDVDQVAKTGVDVKACKVRVELNPVSCEDVGAEKIDDNIVKSYEQQIDQERNHPFVFDAWIISINGMKQLYQNLSALRLKKINTKHFNIDSIVYLLHEVKKIKGICETLPVEHKINYVLKRNLVNTALASEASITLM